MTIKTIAIAMACMTAGLIYAGNVTVGNNDVTVNGAKITWDKSGIIIISKNGQPELCFCFEKFYMKGKNVDWMSVDPKKVTVKKQGNTFTWDLQKTFDGKTYPAGIQTLQVLPDGKLQYSFKFNTIQAPGWAPRTNKADLFIFAPFTAYDNSTVKLNNKEYKLTQAMKNTSGDWNAAKYVYVFNMAKGGTITVTANKGDVSNGTGFYPDKVSKAYRFTFSTNAKQTLTVTIDLSK